tara:strand:+ start:196 stop:822 length:627 start_codon:yes stop_codon:yes gene_type:complete
MTQISRRGLMLALSSPSGAGKTSISRGLLSRGDGLVLSISVTTREKRPGEVDGEDYVFVDQCKFDAMVNDDLFLEHAVVFGNSYGTLRKPVMEALSGGQDILFDVDWQGTQQLRQNALEDLVSIFILPPSIKELERRLYSREQDPEPVVKKRMGRACEEISHWAEYDYIIVNEGIKQSVSVAESILTAERARRKRMFGLTDFVRQMVS